MSSIDSITAKLDKVEQLLYKQNLLLKPVLSFKEACEYLGVSPSFLYKLTSARSIEHSCPNGKMLFFNRQVLDAWMQRNPQRTRPVSGAVQTSSTKGGVKHV